MDTNETTMRRIWSLAGRGASFLRRHRRPLLVLGAVALLAAGLGGTAGATGSRQNGATVETEGENGVEINEKIFSTLRFDDEKTRIRSGQEITFVHDDDTVEPHTATIVDQADLPETFDEVFECGGPGTPCGDAFDAHGDPPAPAVEAPGSLPGLDAPGDSLWLEPGGEISAVVSAPAGSTLYYLCAIHAWMQGQIKVR